MHSTVIPNPEKETGVKLGPTRYNLFIGERYRKPFSLEKKETRTQCKVRIKLFSEKVTSLLY